MWLLSLSALSCRNQVGSTAIFRTGITADVNTISLDLLPFCITYSVYSCHLFTSDCSLGRSFALNRSCYDSTAVSHCWYQFKCETVRYHVHPFCYAQFVVPHIIQIPSFINFRCQFCICSCVTSLDIPTGCIMFMFAWFVAPSVLAALPEFQTIVDW